MTGFVALLNYERMCLKKVMYDQLCKENPRYRMKTMNAKNGELDRTIQHDADKIRRAEKRVGLLEQYVFEVFKTQRYRETYPDKLARREVQTQPFRLWCDG